MAPVLFKWVPFSTPIDFNKKIKGKAIFGPHKTYRGFIFGFLAAVAFIYLQRALAPSMSAIVMIDYNSINVWLWGFLLGWGALFGDLVSSFFKRRLDISPGKSWVPLDQIDWIVGALIFSVFYIEVDWLMAATAVFLSFIFHPLFNYAAYILRIKKNKF